MTRSARGSRRRSAEFGQSTDADPVTARGSEVPAIGMGGASPAGPRDAAGADILQNRYFDGFTTAATGFSVPQVAIAVP